MSRTPEPAHSLSPPSPRTAFEAALARTAASTPESHHDLVAAVRGMDTAGESATALRVLAERPRAVLRLDEAVRRSSGRADWNQSVLPRDTSPLGVALASSHPSGLVREQAVGRLQALLCQSQPGVRGPGRAWVRFSIDGHPYGGREALLWLIEAAGGYDVELP